MTNPIVEFNNQIEDFFSFMIKICPVDDIKCQTIKKEIVTYKGLTNAAIKMNKLSIIGKYIEHVLEHEDQINARDERFFLDDLNYESSGIKTEQSMLQVMKFKSIWHKLNDKHKEKIFEYFIVITYWARQYFNIKFNHLK